jgi:hypothetical protein
MALEQKRYTIPPHATSAFHFNEPPNDGFRLLKLFVVPMRILTYRLNRHVGRALAESHSLLTQSIESLMSSLFVGSMSLPRIGGEEEL